MYHVAFLENEMAHNKEGTTNSEVMKWNASIAIMRDLESQHLKADKDSIETKLNTITAKSWIKTTNGENQDGQGYTKAIFSWAIYFKCSFTMPKFGIVSGLIWPHHNIKYTMNILINKKIMVESKNIKQQEVFGIVEILHHHITCNKAIDNNAELLYKTIQRETKRLSQERIRPTQERKKETD